MYYSTSVLYQETFLSSCIFKQAVDIHSQNPCGSSNLMYNLAPS